MTGYGGGLFGAGLYGGVVGAPVLPDQLGALAALAVEVAWGADPAGDSSAWTWTDITTDVRADPGISWKLGRADESSRSNPASLSLVLDNSESAYSLGGNSANWPNVRRGTPVRVRASLGDATGWRTLFLGFADGWTPRWDTLRGNIAVVELSASGTLRRLTQGASPVVSPIRRYLAATSSVVAYWPMEDGELAEVFAPAVGTAQMTYLGEVDLAQDGDSFLCSAALPTLGAGSIDALVDTYASTDENQVRFLAAFPDSPSWVDDQVLIRIYTSGTIARWDLLYRVGGALRLRGYNTDGTVNFTSSIVAFEVDGTAIRLSVELVQNGSDVDYLFGSTAASATGLTGQWDDTVTGETVGIVTRVEIAPDGNFDGLTVGHLSVQNEQDSLWTAFGPLNAFNGEGITSARLTRLCTENGVGLTLYGNATDLLGGTGADQMGPQDIATLVTLLQQCEDAEQGQLWDGLDVGLAYTTRRRHENADPTLTIDAGAGELAPPFEPVDDDQRTRNRATVKRQAGAEATFEDTDGDLGTEAIGVYDGSLTVNTYSDGSLLDLASWLVHRGTVPGYRYPSVTVDLGATPGLAAEALSLFPGARIDVENLDDALTGMQGETVSLTVEGIQHKLTPYTWRVTATCSPYRPWKIATVAEESDDTAEEAFRVDCDADACSLTSSVSAGATSFDVTIDDGPLWTTDSDDYPLDLDIGGVQVTVTACSGSSSPQTFTCASFPRSLDSGKRVQLYQPATLGL